MVMEIIQGTTIAKHYHGGYIVETMVELDGKTWDITTMKRHRGTILTVAQAVDYNADNGTKTFTCFDNENYPKLYLNEERARATKGKIIAMHKEALEVFPEALKKAQEAA